MSANVMLDSHDETSVFAVSDWLYSIEGLTGSAFDDTLTGDAGNNRLDGSIGSDVLTGGDGSDTYTVDNIGDVVTETNAVDSSGGSDTVLSFLAAYTLGNNIENGRILSTTAANLTGNSGNNVLYGGAGNNVLNGGSGTDSHRLLRLWTGRHHRRHRQPGGEHCSVHRRFRQRHAPQHRAPDRLGLCGQTHRQHGCQQPQWRCG
ncbi:MAG: hypothetical protein IPL11_08985 [Candidatus Accumulibacter sp.]|nr:hypothetical protein [Accumulibacter sp.]